MKFLKATVTVTATDGLAYDFFFHSHTLLFNDHNMILIWLLNVVQFLWPHQTRPEPVKIDNFHIFTQIIEYDIKMLNWK